MTLSRIWGGEAARELIRQSKINSTPSTLWVVALDVVVVEQISAQY